MELVDSNPKGQGRKVLGDNCVVDFESLNPQRRRGPGVFFKKKKGGGQGSPPNGKYDWKLGGEKADHSRNEQM